MNGNQNRSCGHLDGIGDFGFRRHCVARKIKEAKTRFKENGIESVGWIGFVGFGIVTIVRMMGV